MPISTIRLRPDAYLDPEAMNCDNGRGASNLCPMPLAALPQHRVHTQQQELRWRIYKRVVEKLSDDRWGSEGGHTRAWRVQDEMNVHYCFKYTVMWSALCVAAFLTEVDYSKLYFGGGGGRGARIKMMSRR